MAWWSQYGNVTQDSGFYGIYNKLDGPRRVNLIGCLLTHRVFFKALVVPCDSLYFWDNCNISKFRISHKLFPKYSQNLE